MISNSYTYTPLFQITAAASEIDELEAKVIALGGRDDDPKVSKGLDEMLTQTMCKLDGIETNGDADLRAQRKKQIQRCEATSALLLVARTPRAP